MSISEAVNFEPYSIRSLPFEERPRERLYRFGPEALTTAELVAILLGSGSKGRSVLQLAHEIVAHFGSIQALASATVAELCAIKGLGPAKAVQLKAAFNLGIRASKQAVCLKYHVEHPIHVYNLVKDSLSKEKREVFMTILLDTKGCVISQEIISIGTLSEALVHPREVFYPAIRHKAAGLILVHNHPSGDPTPSQEDFTVTAQLAAVGQLMLIPVHDHLVIGSKNFVSLRQEGFNFSFYTERDSKIGIIAKPGL